MSTVSYHCLPPHAQIIVYVEMKRKVRDAVLTMVDRERDGEQIDWVGIDQALLSHLLRCSEISYYAHSAENGTRSRWLQCSNYCALNNWNLGR